MTADELIERMRGLKLQVMIGVPHPKLGRHLIAVPLERLIPFAAAERPPIYDLYGVSAEQYAQWLSEGMAVRCAGKTQWGRPCTRIVTGGARASPQRWVELHGKLCVDHNGGRNLQRRITKRIGTRIARWEKAIRTKRRG